MIGTAFDAILLIAGDGTAKDLQAVLTDGNESITDIVLDNEAGVIFKNGAGGSAKINWIDNLNIKVTEGPDEIVIAAGNNLVTINKPLQIEEATENNQAVTKSQLNAATVPQNLQSVLNQNNTTTTPIIIQNVGDGSSIELNGSTITFNKTTGTTTIFIPEGNNVFSLPNETGVAATRDYVDSSLRNVEYANILPAKSRFNIDTTVTGTHVGNWEIRTANGTTVSISADSGIRIIKSAGASTSNGGLLYPNFFTTQDIGRKLRIEFEAKLISGISSWRINANNNSDIADFVVTEDYTQFVLSVEVGDSFPDKRLLLYQTSNSASTIEIKNMSVYFLSQDNSYDTLFNISKMPNFYNKAEALLNGDAVELVVGIFGDSWTQGVPGEINYVSKITTLLQEKYGNGGGGFYDFSMAQPTGDFMRSANYNDANDSRTGTITYKDQTPDSKGVNIAHSEFGTSSTITLNVLTAQNKLIIHYYAGATYGTFRYRLDGGSWIDVNAALLSGHQTITIDTTSAPHTLDFEVLTGMVILLGVDMHNGTGIRVNRLGNRGLRTHDFNLITMDVWKAAVGALNMDTLTILLGTNDRTGNYTPTAVKSNLFNTITAVKTVNPYCDIALICPSNNLDTARTYTMLQYGVDMYRLAKDFDIPYIDLIPLFGSSNRIAAKGTFASTYHPNINGGNVVARYLFKHFFNID